MQTCTIEVSGIPEMTLQRLDERAQRQGRERMDFIRDLLNREAHNPTLSEILMPFREQVAASGINDEELDQLFEEARDEAYREQQGKSVGK